MQHKAWCYKKNKRGGAAAHVYQNKAAHFTATSSQLMKATNPTALQISDQSWSWCCWVNMDSKTAERAFFSKFNSAGSRSWVATYDNIADRFRFYVSTDGTTLFNVQDSHLGSPATSTWYFLAGYYDFAGTQIKLSVNNGVMDVTGSVPHCFNSSADFYLSTYAAGSTSPMDGAIDSMGIWKGKVFTAAEITALYAAGAGVAYYDLATINGGSLASPTVFYDLDDAGGSGATWTDATATVNLTAGTTTAAPTSVAGKR